MTDDILAKMDTELKDVEGAVADPDGAADELPEPEKKEYIAAQESVVEARRMAEINSGLYQVH